MSKLKTNLKIMLVKELIKSPLPALIYLLVLVGGISMFFMLTFEYREAKLLIKNNQFLMNNTVTKTLTANVSDKLADYPVSKADVDLNWRKLPTHFMANYQGQWIFPKRFSGEYKNSLSDLWRYYELDSNSSKLEASSLPNESKLRIKALIQIKLALKTNDKSRLTKHTVNYFSLVENYQLSVLEEIISSLRFLQLENDARWNNQLIELMIFQGSNQVIPLVDYIFKHNNRLSKLDLETTIDKVQLILEKANIDTNWFNQSVQQLWNSNLEINLDTLKAHSIIDNKWISVTTSKDLLLFLPFSTELELKAVESTLKFQGILDEDDSLSIDNTIDDNVIRTISELPINIQRKKWRKQAEQQSQFFTIKISLTSVFIISLFAVVAFIAYRNKKKTEFIDLRENFINLVSHELKTPLASIRIMIETLQKRDNRQLSIKDYPDKIINEVDRLWLMVDNLLSINQIKSGELELNIDKIDLNTMIERVYEKFNEHQTKKLVLENNLPADCSCTLDPLLFELVIINLFSNAVKYCDKSTIEITMSFNAQANKLIFSDNACGIKQVSWTRVFDDFYRDTSTNAKQGTGVGLSLCKQIMKTHHGRIKIEASSEEGTTWAIYLPVIEKNHLPMHEKK